MKYDFDAVTDRRGTSCYKYDVLPGDVAEGGAEHMVPIPVSIADMDFQCAEPIIRALHERIDHGIFGYTCYKNEECRQAVTGWYRRRFGWEINQEEIFFSPGVVPALALLIQFLTEEGDGIIIQRPVYPPFTGKIEANGRKAVNNPLVRNGNTYEMDLEDLERKFADGNTKGMILCSPHNPAGRVWTEAELRSVVDIAKKYDKWIVSDEIHSDLTRTGVTHTPLLKLAPDYRERMIVCTAPSKTFNLAGMLFSNIIIPNREYQERWTDVADRRFSLAICSPFGMTATIAAYRDGEEWLDQVRAYIDGNIRYVEDYVKENLPKAEVMDCQGTYLVWLDLNGYCSDSKRLEVMMVKEAGIVSEQGYTFGPEGSGFERINVATQRSNVEECMRRMKAVVMK